VSVATALHVFVLFAGAQVRHGVTPVTTGDLRVMLTMTYCTDPRLGRLRKVVRRVKDVGLSGLHALWDSVPCNPADGCAAALLAQLYLVEWVDTYGMAVDRWHWPVFS
jgi:hypothetical protein